VGGNVCLEGSFESLGPIDQREVGVYQNRPHASLTREKNTSPGHGMGWEEGFGSPWEDPMAQMGWRRCGEKTTGGNLETGVEIFLGGVVLSR